MQGTLVRVGIDSTCGHWHGPCTSDSRYLYVPIPESENREFRRNLRRSYRELEGFLAVFDLSLPDHLRSRGMHLDPDFDHLTYGDQSQRAAQLQQMAAGDFLAFYGAFQNYHDPGERLSYCLFGVLTITETESATDVPEHRWHENAHTRRLLSPDNRDIVVRGGSRSSGRFNKLLPIGEFRNRAYRVRKDLLKEWGDLDISDGYLQRSARLPNFVEPDRFLLWLDSQEVSLVHCNWE